MKQKMLTEKGKRILREGKGKRVLSLVLAAVMLAGLLALPGMGVGEMATAVGPSDKNQVITPGGIRYYSETGEDAGESKYDVSVKKTVKQATDGSGTPIENLFDVDLTVETKTNYKEIVTTRDAAVVLVIDLSSSMTSECANCGETEKPCDASRAAVHYAKGAAPKQYCITPKRIGDLYAPNISGICLNCTKDASSHALQEPFVSRLETA